MFFNKEPGRLSVVAPLIMGADTRELRLESLEARLTDCCRAATAIRYVAKQGEAGADAAVVWADSD